jgi:hypothetical protein
MVILIDGITYKLVEPENEAELESHIEENYKQIFGDNSIYFPKTKIKSKAGIGTIPDAFVIIPEHKLRWCILEVELASHPVYEHVFPQLTKFRRAVEDVNSRKKISEFFYDTIKSDQVLEAQFRKLIGSGEIYKFITDMVNEKPLIVVAVDNKTEELEEALLDFGGDVEVVEFKTFKRQGIEGINAYAFEPLVSSEKGLKIDRVIETGKVGTSGKRGGIMDAIYSLFAQKGVDNVSYDECLALAKSIKPDTAFKEGHFSWYKWDYGVKNKSNGSKKS